MNDTTHDVTEEDKTAALCAATDYCREAINEVGVPEDATEEARTELDALETIHDEALAGWFEGRDVDLSDENLHRAQKALWTLREKALDSGDFTQAVEAEMALRDLMEADP